MNMYSFVTSKCIGTIQSILIHNLKVIDLIHSFGVIIMIGVLFMCF